MPIYEFECKKCSTVFETLVAVTGDEQIKCEKCGSRDVRKLISAAGIKVSSKSGDKPAGCQARGGFS